GRREVGHALGYDAVDRLGDDAVLEHRLKEVDDIIDDHPGTRSCQGANVRGEARLSDFGRRKGKTGAPGGGEAAIVRGKPRLSDFGRRKGKTGARGYIVDDLQHRPTLVGS